MLTLVLALTIAQAAQPAATPPAPTDAIDIKAVGFKTPECVVWDPVDDVYLVSNIHGHPLDKDDNGFISRVKPDGKVEALKWIDGAGEAITLHAPKGMALLGDVLWVTDIDVVRRFDRKTGKAYPAIEVKDATFLNDICSDGVGAIYITDTGLQRDEKTILAPNGKPRFVHIDVETADVSVQTMEQLASVYGSKDAIGLPNGVVFHGEDVALVTWDSGALHRFEIDTQGKRSMRTVKLPKAQLDGLLAHDGGWLVSCWEAKCVYAVTGGSDKPEFREVVSGVNAPADLGFDSKRGRVLIPLFMDDAVAVRPVGKR